MPYIIETFDKPDHLHGRTKDICRGLCTAPQATSDQALECLGSLQQPLCQAPQVL